MKKMVNELIEDVSTDNNQDDITIIKVWDKNKKNEESEIDDEYLFDVDTRPRIKDDLDVPTYHKVFFYKFHD